MAVTLKTYGQQLAEVQEAIFAVNTAQRYEINGRVVQRADLQFLQKREEWLTQMLNTYGDITAGSAVTRGSATINFGNAE